MPFIDVTCNDWFYDSVKGAWQNYLIDGVTATTYQPNGTLTVAEAIKLAAALHQLDKDGKVTPKNGKVNWYDSYVEYGIVNGILDESYASRTRAQMDTPVTRREFVHILYHHSASFAVVFNYYIKSMPTLQADGCLQGV
mgnify:CR=1 FL=1